MIRLLELRNEKGLTQRQLAKVLNISQGTYNNWENGNTEPSIEQIIKLADYFDVTTDLLLGRTDDKTIERRDNASNEFLRLYNSSPQEVQQAIIILLGHINGAG